MAEVTQYYPTAFTADDLAAATTIAQITESFVAEAIDAYHARDEIFPGGETEARQVEREVMLQIIDQRWREHLSEMDYLREGINLRAMGQLDPLVAWQREGFQMFGQMMDAIDDDYLRYVMHVQVVTGSRRRARPHPGPLRSGRGPLAGPQPSRRLPGHRPRGRRSSPPVPVCPVGVGAGGQFADGAQPTPQHPTTWTRSCSRW